MGDNTITDTKVGQWDTSYGWGDHRALGLVTHGTFGSEGIIKRGSTSGDYSFITDNSSNWNTAHGWGNHASAGYLTASSTNTLTNKSIDSDNNTITNIVDADIKAGAAIAITKLASSAITIAGQSTSLGGSITADTIAGQISADTISGNQIEGGTIGSTTITTLTTTGITATNIGHSSLSLIHI